MNNFDILLNITCHLSKEYLLNLLSIRGGVLIYAVHCMYSTEVPGFPLLKRNYVIVYSSSRHSKAI